MKPARTAFQVLKKKLLGALLLVVCLSGLTMAQSVLSDDAHTSTLPKDLDTNFGTNPNLSATSVSSVSRWCGFTRNSSTTETQRTQEVAQRRARSRLFVQSPSAAQFIDTITPLSHG